MTTLAYAGTTIELSDDMTWADEYEWAAVAQSVRYTLTGSMVREETGRAAGRTITLQGAEDCGWVSREALEVLRGWAELPGITLILTLRGVTRAVFFDHDAGPIEAEPVVQFSDPEPQDPYIVTLRFRTLPT